MGHPIVGDATYAREVQVQGAPGSALHLAATRLSLLHPASGARMEVRAPVPALFADSLVRIAEARALVFGGGGGGVAGGDGAE